VVIGEMASKVPTFNLPCAVSDRWEVRSEYRFEIFRSNDFSVALYWYLIYAANALVNKQISWCFWLCS
jgi:hypothetical protein